MKTILLYARTILIFILIDAFSRSLMPAIHLANAPGGQNPFVGNLFFYMVYFILFFSWFYWPIAIAFVLVSYLFRKERNIFIWGGLVTALVFYFTYCSLYSVFEVGYPEFYVRIVMYSLMGACFGSVRFKTISR